MLVMKYICLYFAMFCSPKIIFEMTSDTYVKDYQVCTVSDFGSNMIELLHKLG